MAEEASEGNASEVEVYAELGLMPKVGARIRLTREERLRRVIGIAAEHAEIGRLEFEDRLAASEAPVTDVVAAAALRAGEVDDETYLDVLSRLIAGALDQAEIDEWAYLTSEVTKLDPVHLRALLKYFFFGREDNSRSESGLGPAEAGWASLRDRTDGEIANLLSLSEEVAGQVTTTLRRDGYLDQQPSRTNGGVRCLPSRWAVRVLTRLFPKIEVHEERRPDTEGRANQHPKSNTPSTPRTQDGETADDDPSIREHRAIAELEKEIKSVERQQVQFGRAVSMQSDAAWLEKLKRRLRRVDPNNPWAYDDLD